MRVLYVYVMMVVSDFGKRNWSKPIVFMQQEHVVRLASDELMLCYI